MNEESTLKPTPEFFSMILYNSDPQSKVSCALTFFVEKSIMRLADIRAAIRFFADSLFCHYSLEASFNQLSWERLREFLTVKISDNVGLDAEASQ